jgi:hypothetical protein
MDSPAAGRSGPSSSDEGTSSSTAKGSDEAPSATVLDPFAIDEDVASAASSSEEGSASSNFKSCGGAGGGAGAGAK